MKKAILWLLPSSLLLLSIAWACQKETTPKTLIPSEVSVTADRGPCGAVTISGGTTDVGICGLPTGSGISDCDLCGFGIYRDDVLTGLGPQTFTLATDALGLYNFSNNPITVTLTFNCAGIPVTIPADSKIFFKIDTDPTSGCCFLTPYSC